MPTPAISSPITLPRQASPVYTSKPFFSSSLAGSATLQSTSPVMAHQSSMSPVAAQYGSATSTVTAQHSNSSTATAAMLASLKQQCESDLSLGSVSPPREAEQQAGLQTQATATSRRYVSAYRLRTLYMHKCFLTGPYVPPYVLTQSCFEEVLNQKQA